MIDYLDELERDLVQAIDRRQGAAPRRIFPRLRLDFVAAAVALALAIALVALIGSRDEQESEPVKQPTTATVTNPKPIPKGTPLRVAGGLKRIGPNTWSGPARGPGGGGMLTLTGEVDLSARPCCETPRSVGRTAHVLQFRWATPRGVLGGCVVNTVLRRPYGRFVWDGPGLVKVATGGFARYRGRPLALAGETRVALPSRARIILGGDARPPGGC
jgi:hypothetical protein